MSIDNVLTQYYAYANAGDWNNWCDLFAADMVMDEQLAGHVEGRERLRAMMSGFGDMYSSFQNVPRTFVVDHDNEQAAVISRVVATSAAGEAIEADVVNYFMVHDDQITYMSNYHDTVPFKALAAR
jgi:ketosteroid isomerase-like protein